MRLLFVGIACSLLLGSATASATKFTMDFTPSSNQAHRMVAGVAAIESSGTTSKVRLVAPDEPVKKRGRIQLLVFNGSTLPFDVGSDNVTAKPADGTLVAIISPQQLAHEEKKRATWRAIAAGLGAMGNSMSAASSGRNNSTVNYSANTFGTYGSSYTNGTALVSSYSPAQAQLSQSLANIENQQTFDRLTYANAAGKLALGANLSTSTIDPGNATGGVVTFELPPAARDMKQPVQVTFSIRAGVDQHSILATFTPK